MQLRLGKTRTTLALAAAAVVVVIPLAQADPVPPYPVQTAACLVTSGPACQPPSPTQDFTGTITPIGTGAPYADVRHPNSTTEWWYFNLTNPADGSVYITNFEIGPNELAPNNDATVPAQLPVGFDHVVADVSTVWFDKDGVAEGCHAQPCAHRNYITYPAAPFFANADPQRPPKVTNSLTGTPTEYMEYVPGQGTLHYRSPLNGAAYAVTLPAYHVYDVSARRQCCSTQTFDADFWLTGIHRGFSIPGMTAAGDRDHPFIAWVNPVMDSRVVGFLRPPCAAPTDPTSCVSPPLVDLSTWRGYHDHNYGAFDITQQSGWKGYDWGVAHLPGGGGTLMGSATLDLPFVRGGMPGVDTDTFGFLMRSDSTGQHFCQADSTSAGHPTFTQSGGATIGPEQFAYPRTTTLACHFQPKGRLAFSGGPVTYHATDPFLLRGPGFSFTEALGTTDEAGVPTRSTALIEHFRNWSNLGCCP